MIGPTRGAGMRSRWTTPRRELRWIGRSAACALPLGPPSSANLLGGHGVVGLLPIAFLGAALLAVTIWMIGRWGARPPVLPAGVAPQPRAQSGDGERPVTRPAGTRAPAATP